jgi:2-keto-3-deoxy-L-rhamnonate aldolase RhmA
MAGGAPYGWSIKAALDAGADGVIVPQVRTVDEVRSIVSDCRYPTGPNRQPPYDRKQTGPSTHLDYRKRGMGHSECWLATVPSHVGLKQPHMAMLLDFAAVIPSNYFREPFYKYTAEADQSIYCVMQMETKEALECVEDICAVPGLDSIVYYREGARNACRVTPCLPACASACHPCPVVQCLE